MVRIQVTSDVIKQISINTLVKNGGLISINLITDQIIQVLNEYEIPFYKTESTIEYIYPNSIDILDKLLKEKSIYESTKNKLNELFVELLNPESPSNPLVCHFALEDPRAVVPSKVRCSDSGYDLTIIKEKSRSGNAILYDTGVKIIPPQGYNLVIRPRSSFYKTGYMIANTIGTIDTSYRNTFFVPLIKIDQTKPDIELPFKGFQIVLERFNHFEMVKATDQFQSETHRNLGGFGSTDSSIINPNKASYELCNVV